MTVRKALWVPLLALSLGVASPAAAQRTSLAGIEAKLDQLLAQGGGDLGNHVTLVDQFDADTVCPRDRSYVRLFPDGTTAPEEFIVPDGFLLVLHDISWQARDDPTAFVPGRTLRLVLIPTRPSGGSTRAVYVSPKVEITSANENALLGANETLTAGVVFAAGTHVCASVGNNSQTGFASNTVSTSILRGFLVPNP